MALDTSGMRVSHDDTPDDEYTITIVGDGPYEAEEELIEAARGAKDKFAKSGDRIRKVGGLNSTTKRRITRTLNKARGEGDAKSKKQEEKLPTGYALFDVVRPPYNMEYLSKLYEISAPHHAAVDAKVTNTVGLGYNFVESAKVQDKLARIDNEDTLERVRRRVAKGRRELEDWLDDTTNSEDTFEEVIRKVMTDYEVLGNGYLEIGRTTRGKIGYIGHIPATTIRRRVQKDGYIQLIANNAVFFRNYGENAPNPIGDDANPNEIIHFRKYSPTNNFYGVPDILAAKNAVAGDEFASRFNLDYFEHKAVPRYIVTLKGAQLDAASEKRLVDFFSANLKGQHHRTLYVPLPPDRADTEVEFEMNPVESKVQDASFVKYHDMNRDDILMAHRTPLSQTGATMNISLGAAKEAARMFSEQVARPVQNIVEKKLKPVFREVTDAFEFHLVEMSLTDEETASRIHERYLRWDVYTPNDILEWLGKNGRDDGDEPVGVMAQAKLKADTSQTTARANATREQDAERSGGPDSARSDRSRNAQGEGRQTE